MRRQERQEIKMPDLPDIIGLPKPVERHALPMNASKRQTDKSKSIPDNFETETEEKALGLVIPQEELDEVFGSMPDLEDEENGANTGMRTATMGLPRGLPLMN